VGQVAIGVVAIGQVAIGAISIGQAAIALGWGVGQLAWGMLAAGQVAAGLLRSVELGSAGEIAHVAARVVSPDRLRGPLSGVPCVYWHTVDVGPAVRHHEHDGTEVTIADAGGTARLDLGQHVTFIRSDHYREIAGPDWALHLETSLAQGDEVHVAGPLTAAPDHDRGGAFRGGISPLFQGRPDQPLIVSTRHPLGLRAELRFAGAMAWASLAAGALALLGWLS